MFNLLETTNRFSNPRIFDLARYNKLERHKKVYRQHVETYRRTFKDKGLREGDSIINQYIGTKGTRLDNPDNPKQMLQRKVIYTKV